MVVKMKAAEREQNARVYNATQAVLQQIYKDLAPVAQRSAVDAAEKHATAIRAAHKDFDAVIVNVPAWIKKQPSYLQVAYQKAYDEGSTQDVIDLVARFKAETGNGTAKTAAQIAAEEAAKKEADDKAAKLAADAASGMPVGTRRSAPSTKGAPDPTDYDGAFAEAAASK